MIWELTEKDSRAVYPMRKPTSESRTSGREGRGGVASAGRELVLAGEGIDRFTGV